MTEVKNMWGKKGQNYKRLFFQQLVVMDTIKSVMAIAMIKIGIYGISVKGKLADAKYDTKTCDKKFEEKEYIRVIKIQGNEIEMANKIKDL